MAGAIAEVSVHHPTARHGIVGRQDGHDAGALDVGQFVASLTVGADYRVAIADEDVLDAALARIQLAVLITVVEDHATDGSCRWCGGDGSSDGVGRQQYGFYLIGITQGVAGVVGQVLHRHVVDDIDIAVVPRPVLVVVIDGIADERCPVRRLLQLQGVLLDKVLPDVGQTGLIALGVVAQLLHLVIDGSYERVDVGRLTDEGNSAAAEE